MSYKSVFGPSATESDSKVRSSLAMRTSPGHLGRWPESYASIRRTCNLSREGRIFYKGQGSLATELCWSTVYRKRAGKFGLY